MKKSKKYLGGIICLLITGSLFCYIGSVMGTAAMFNTIMNTAHDLLLNTVFYLMGICVITGAIGKLFVEFGVVDLLELILRPLMKPLFRMPGVASLGAVMTFISDNPAIISLAQDQKFKSYFKKYQYISLTNFGTAFGMGLIVIVYMIGQGYSVEPFIGLFGSFCGCIVSTRLMQKFILKQFPEYKFENAGEEIATSNESTRTEQFATSNESTRAEQIATSNESTSTDQIQSQCQTNNKEKKSIFLRTLDSLLDGGKSGVEVGIAIIPGVLIISTLVMILTFGPSDTGKYTGAAYEGIELLPHLANKAEGFFNFIFGFDDPHQIAFPITALGAVGAALSLIPGFATQGWIDGNAIAVFTAIGLCWSGFLSTHTAMLDSIGYRNLTSKAIIAHTIGGLVAGIAAHWIFILYSIIFL